MTIGEIIEGCRLGGISLEQRLAVVEYSTLPRSKEEAALILNEIDRRKRAALAARAFGRIG